MQARGFPAKVGRNQQCPCGSRKKFKHCHGKVTSATAPSDSLAAGLSARIAEMEALHRRREQQQGLGRPIISTVFNEYRIVAVRNRIMWSTKWRTFEDFLMTYIRHALGSDWGNRELAKPLAERHPILKCYDMVCNAQSAAGLGDGKVKEMVATGAITIYVHLAYYLYLIDHNSAVQERLLERLRNAGQFQAARYELAVAALFTLAGFSLEFENEGDSRTTHMEFTATHLRSGRKYSVECKSKHRNGLVWCANGSVRAPDVMGEVRDHLYKALRKKALHDRVVFIELNLPDGTREGEVPGWADEVDAALRAAESDLTVDGQKPEPAYVVVTNDTCLHNLETAAGACFVFMSAFLKPDFHSGQRMTLREAVGARERHRDILLLGQSVRAWRCVPSTFDGEIPERALQGREAPWQIGRRYMVPIDDQSSAEGVLEEAIMVPPERKMYGTYALDDGRRVICSAPVDDDEMRIYERYPDSYFGVVQHVGGRLNSPLEVFDFFYNSYKDTPKQKLLELMSKWSDQARLQAMTQSELATLYCEQLANGLLSRGWLEGGS